MGRAALAKAGDGGGIPYVPVVISGGVPGGVWDEQALVEEVGRAGNMLFIAVVLADRVVEGDASDGPSIASDDGRVQEVEVEGVPLDESWQDVPRVREGEPGGELQGVPGSWVEKAGPFSTDSVVLMFWFESFETSTDLLFRGVFLDRFEVFSKFDDFSNFVYFDLRSLF